MIQLELWHIGMVIAGLLGFLAVVYLWNVVAIHWETITLTTRAAFRRFVTVPSRQEFLARLADDYDDSRQPVPTSEFPPVDGPSAALDGGSSQSRTTQADGEAWTAEEILRQLATIKRIDKDGTPVYLSKEKLAALVNMRAEEARAIINEERGEAPIVSHDPRFPESTKDGRPVASHLKTRGA
jgi:hypothetical protein